MLPGHDCKTLCKFKNTDYIAKSKYNTKEKEANAFAAQLLMPDIFIKETLEKVMPNEIEKIKQETRRYAKRQLTWFRRNKQIIWLDGLDDMQNNLQIILKGVKGEE